jgi:hypothetical protein
MYCFTLSLTPALDVSRRSTAGTGGVNPRNSRYPFYRRLGGLQGWSGRVRNTPSPPVFDPLTFQPVASRYTDCLSRTMVKIIIDKF